MLACLSRRRSRVQIPSRALAARYANRQSGQAQTLVTCGFDSRLRHFAQHATIGHWQAQLAVTQPSFEDLQVQLLLVALKNHGSFVYRYRTLAPQAGKAGSTPARATEHDQVAQLVDARRSECHAVRHGSSTLPLVTETLQARQVPNWLSYGRCARFDTGACNCGWAKAQPGPISTQRLAQW